MSGTVDAARCTGAIEWLPWGADSFARARAESKPILLSIAASWCACCEQMDRTSYADPHAAALIRARFIPVRVDADRRPDVSDRYSLGGWPTIAFLTADGDLVGGGTYVTDDRIVAVLERAADAFVTRAGEIAARALTPQATSPHTVDAPPSTADLLDITFESYDAEHGGFGGTPKFPLTAPIHLALDLYASTGAARWAEVAIRSLDAIGWGGLHDDVDGGFFRCAGRRDWGEPHLEKLLEVNARLLHVFVDAADLLGIDRFRDRAADILQYLRTWLADLDHGGWAGSQRADPSYYAAVNADIRRALTPPHIDRAMYADANAVMVSAALRAAASRHDDDLRDFALKSLERVLLACYRPGHGVAHYLLDNETGPVLSERWETGRVEGFLADQIAMAAANLDADAVSGNVVYRMMAEELARHAVATMWDSTAGGFFDTAPDNAAIGLLRTRVKPFQANCEAARMLRRLSVVSGEPEFAPVAAATLDALAPAARAHGPLAAHLLLALLEPAR